MTREAPPAAAAAPARVLVRLPNPIGDMVMSTPALRALRAHWPQARIVAAGPGPCVPLLEGLPFLDELVPLPSRAKEGLTGLRSAAARLRAQRFEIAILFANSFSSAFTTLLAGIPRRVGYRGGGRDWLLTKALGSQPEAKFHRMPQPMPEFYARLLDSIGVPRAGHRTQLAVRPEDEARAEQWLARHGLGDGTPLYGFHGGASFGPSKLWYPERWAAVADTLHARHGGRTLLFCGPGEEDTVRAIAAAAQSPVASAVDDPIDLRLLKAMAKRLSLFVGTDAGPRHIAVAFDVPTVALLGSTDPRFSNTNLAHSVVVRTGVECSPCHLKVCPIDHRCMTRMSAEMVLAACERVLAGG
ncbi:MAG TPA: lipopolysaccharide heptosyltransferase II [Planctomycetota bacterium]|nr:lipopolysaccharide heptosyltransferase II [Planctomycetota bacterium]